MDQERGIRETKSTSLDYGNGKPIMLLLVYTKWQDLMLRCRLDFFQQESKYKKPRLPEFWEVAEIKGIRKGVMLQKGER